MIVGRTQPLTVPLGTLIAGKYRVDKELGRGGFGVVLRAVHTEIGQVVALKILAPGEGGTAAWAEDAARFEREAQATAALRSEHVVRILDVDVLPDGCPYMVMEYLEGETLHHALHVRAPLSVAESVDHAVQVLAALAEAHAAGIVHRDLKPANVLVVAGAGGTPVAKVLDFGVSKIGAHSGIGSGSASPLTRTGAVIGTVAYMAPEQMLDAKRVDARADLWSVGIMLFELLTKQTPFGPATSPTLVTQMLTQPPVSLRTLRPDVPPSLEKVLLRCLAKEPDQRYATAAAVGAALAPMTSPRARGALDALRRSGPPTGAAAPGQKGAPALFGPPRSRGERPSRAATLARVAAVAGAIAAVALLAIAAFMFLGRPRPGGRAADRDAGATRAAEAAAASSPKR